MKRKLLLKLSIAALLCALSCLSGFGLTYAYLTDRDASDDAMTVGEVKATICETYSPPRELSPNMQFDKAPYIVNTGSLPCFVRMRADYTTVNAARFCALAGTNEQDWILAEDGYYYYKHLLDAGETTVSAPFSKVSIGDCDAELLEDFDIAVYAEAVQHIDHEGAHPSDEYRTAWIAYHN